MFIQQPVRIVATPTRYQDGGVMLDTLLRMYYTARAATLSTPTVQVLRIESVSAVQLGTSTQLDLLLSVEAETLDDFQAFVRSLIPRETTDDFEVVTVGYNGY